MDPMAAIRDTFFQECEEQLSALEEGLLEMEDGNTSLDTVNAVFRAVHSIKGGAGAFKLTELVSFAHVFETCLDKIRSQTLQPDPDVIKLLLRSADILADLVTRCRQGTAIEKSLYEGLQAELENVVGGLADDQSAEDDFGSIDFTPTVIAVGGFESEPAEPTGMSEASGEAVGPVASIMFRPHSGLYAKANEPLVIIRELATLGKLACRTSFDLLPDIEAFDPAENYLSFEISIEGNPSYDDITSLFEFVEGDCDLKIEMLAGDDVAPAPADSPVLEAPVNDTMPTADDIIARVLGRQAGSEPTGEVIALPAGTSAVDERAEKPVEKAADRGTEKGPATKAIRVDLDRIDRLINLVGELVINQAMLSLRVSQSGAVVAANVGSSLEELERLTRDIQESVMAIRAQPVKSLFQRMSRIVREVADQTGKAVRLRTDGEATEIDKTVVDLLADPLTHMIRNAVDHGLEMPDRRREVGKPEEGTVRLSAAHKSGKVVITIADDGAGINRPKVLEIARRKGLVTETAQLSDNEIDNLLFLPGFSTATNVSSISGRGVGMDVVKRSIQSLGGRISIDSKPGHGSVFTMSLPLTLAVLDGIVVSVADQTYVVPLTAVVETLMPESGMLSSLGANGQAIRVRDRFLPVVDVGQVIGIRSEPADRNSCVAVLVETDGHGKSALIVDRIQDQRQVVIKSLETNYGPVEGVAAATILGDGRVAMILDVDTLIGRGSESTSSAQNMVYAKAS
ncbi:MAG: chemotaxis protein CheA [Proteobacteria bacterium]|nr:chemotaxis protein CheA [Pseudomonadota bacterium]